MWFHYEVNFHSVVPTHTRALRSKFIVYKIYAHVSMMIKERTLKLAIKIYNLKEHCSILVKFIFTTQVDFTYCISSQA